LSGTEQIITECTVEVDEEFIIQAVVQELKAQGFTGVKGANIEWEISQGFLLKGATIGWQEQENEQPSQG